MRRELMEEAGIEAGQNIPVALMNDDSTEVDIVCFGVVHLLSVPDESIASRRSGIAAPEFVSFSEAVKDLAGYESWSRFCLEQLELLLEAGRRP